MKNRPELALIFAIAVFLSAGALNAEDLIHVVGKGDTIYSIARFFQITPDELMKANGISDPSKLQVGKKLIIPAVTVTEIKATPAPAPAKPQTLVNYKIVKGDTLYSIARKEGITLQTLQEINKFATNHVIKVGDTIKVPGKSTTSTNTTPAAPVASETKKTGDFSVRWPVNPKEISYMTGQMGVVVEGELFESVKSLTQGKVISAGPWRKFGKVAIVEVSGGYFYMYGGCESLTVKVGDKINPGAELGKLGNNSVADKPNLYFMVFRNDTPIDPAKAPRAGV